ncbi:hypothetical protein AQJ30_15475 [Streptomyces longwoodensis]|uniref:Uncharacterized protein n=1 Tax=Streptomyces longwoodensis TaxID=68231 RepID=A0A101QXE6_9ACTN|nr:hypothetical protein [Streptomyces longwoodensis]KUN37683.1 hypothetical protein AQJ30_15475 [Streptomyces longwoodensis]
MAERVDHVDLCPDCQGVRVLPATRISDVTVHMDGSDHISYRGKATVTVIPLPDPCPNPRREVPDGPA